VNITYSTIDGHVLKQYRLQQNLAALDKIAAIVGEDDQRIRDARAAFRAGRVDTMTACIEDIKQGI
jgi:hypothetical protein